MNGHVNIEVILKVGPLRVKLGHVYNRSKKVVLAMANVKVARRFFNRNCRVGFDGDC